MNFLLHLFWFLFFSFYHSFPEVVNIKDKNGKSLLVVARDTDASSKVVRNIKHQINMLTIPEDERRSSIIEDATKAIKNLFAANGMMRGSLHKLRSFCRNSLSKRK